MIFLIIILATILRLINLDQSLWLDEATQAILSKSSIYSIIFQRGVDFHPPLSYLIMHFWIKLGTSEIWLRLLSVIFGVFTILLTYKVTKELFSRNVALVASFLLAINPYHIYYSQEVRMYAEAALFGTLSVFFFYLSTAKPKFLNYLGYILSTTALIYTHYDGFFLIFTQILYLLIIRKDKIRYFLSPLFIVFLLYIPWIPQFLIQLLNGLRANEYLPGWREALSLPFYKAVPLTFIKFSFGRISIEENFTHYLLAVLILGVVGFIFFNSPRRMREKNYQLVLFWFLIPILKALIISFQIPLNQPFRILYIIPAFCILLALGILNLGRVKNLFIGIIVVISLSGLILYYGSSKYQREDWRGASKFILKNINENSLVLFAWPQPFSPYTWYAKDKQSWGVVLRFPAEKREIEDNLRNLNQTKDVYIFEYLQDLSDPRRYVQGVIEENGFRLVKVYDFSGVGFINHYVKEN
ncbi:hypothetical protein A3B45_00200 [Candidatus Daviesbacteria bacterium RIFCSPLOWO2_01_FULL_39_12]|uniref:Glycosyltransferase RgtA/B/C/D-like domain-containing protein n=1 Tax=Candidatus Daviesbacteria bacterium RIFCSPLOWO2_01_FULL_39_12 TaxID=1797785 RepID=A0A1F5KP98_9BACT|nr:MAG: hypothetical protein A3B45_00200 [Candidatus Daviesbacteria bacterium RIFCSPLOWO2_01_FULL_39_12]